MAVTAIVQQQTVKKKRTRASVPRVRTGCGTCKIRRVKCDEERPACRKCIKTSRHCDGYRIDPPVAPSAALRMSIASYAIPFQIPGSQTDRRILHYFCVQGNAELAGFVTSDFWSRIVLQYSSYEPVVRHALVALSAAHLEYSTRDSTLDGVGLSRSSEEEVLPQYNKAIRLLRKYMAAEERPSKTVVLICCLLLYHFEGVRGAYNIALEHLKNGLQILQRMEAEVQNDPLSSSIVERGEDLDQLTQIFARLDLEATALDATRVPLPLIISERQRIGVPLPATGEAFRSLEDARFILDQLQSQTFQFIRQNLSHKHTPLEELPESILRPKYAIIEQYNRWETALRHFAANRIKKDTRQFRRQTNFDPIIRGTMLLQLHQLTNRMFLMSNLPEDFTVYGGPGALLGNSLAEEILILSETLLQQTHTTGPLSASEKRRSYSSEMGIVTPLLSCTVRSPDITISRRAASLLEQTSHRREGLFDTLMSVGVAKHIIRQREQNTLSEDQPGLARSLISEQIERDEIVDAR